MAPIDYSKVSTKQLFYIMFVLILCFVTYYVSIIVDKVTEKVCNIYLSLIDDITIDPIDDRYLNSIPNTRKGFHNG